MATPGLLYLVKTCLLRSTLNMLNDRLATQFEAGSRIEDKIKRLWILRATRSLPSRGDWVVPTPD